jgi:monoamine oxidase
MIDVLVIGAGMAGLTAARELRRSGLGVRVVEARNRIGGRVYSVRDFCEAAVEGGAEFIHGVRARHWPEVRDAGLGVRPCPLLRHTILSLGDRTRWLPRLLLEPWIWSTFGIFRGIRGASGVPDQSAREFLERRGYHGLARVLAEATLTSHLPASVDEIGMHGLLDDGVIELERGVNHRVDDGYDALPARLARGLDVALEVEVEEIRWSPRGVACTTRQGETLEARAAVCTLPLGVLQSGDVRFQPELPAAKRSALRALGMGPVVKVLLRFRERFWPSWLAMAACVTGPVTLYWPVFHGRHDAPPVLTAYATGPRAALLGRVGEAEAAEIVVTDLRRLFPKTDPRPLLESARRIDWTADVHARGGYSFVRPNGVGARARLAASDTGALFWAGSATASRPIAASVEAAYVSGLRAAGEARVHLGAVPHRVRPSHRLAALRA